MAQRPLGPGAKRLNGLFEQKKVGKHDLFLRASATQSRLFVYSGPKVGPDFDKEKTYFHEFFTHGFHCQMENNKAAPSAPPQRSGALRVPPLWALLFSIWQWKPRMEKFMEIVFFIQARPNFWPQIESRLWVVLALDKKYQGP